MNAPSCALAGSAELGLELSLSVAGLAARVPLTWSALWHTYLPLCAWAARLVVLQAAAPPSSWSPARARLPRVLVGVAGAGGSGKSSLCEVR